MLNAAIYAEIIESEFTCTIKRYAMAAVAREASGCRGGGGLIGPVAQPCPNKLPGVKLSEFRKQQK